MKLRIARWMFALADRIDPPGLKPIPRKYKPRKRT